MVRLITLKAFELIPKLIPFCCVQETNIRVIEDGKWKIDLHILLIKFYRELPQLQYGDTLGIHGK